MEATAIVGIPSLLTWFAEAHAMLGHHAEGLNCLAEAAQVMAADTWLNIVSMRSRRIAVSNSANTPSKSRNIFPAAVP